MEIICFSANVRPGAIAYSRCCACTILFSNLLYFLLQPFLAGQGSGNLLKRIYVSGWFVQMENNKCTPNIQTIKFITVLRTFEAKILKREYLYVFLTDTTHKFKHLDKKLST